MATSRLRSEDTHGSIIVGRTVWSVPCFPLALFWHRSRLPILLDKTNPGKRGRIQLERREGFNGEVVRFQRS